MRKRLVMPTTITAQDGKQIIQKTKITVTGCAAVKIKPLTRSQKLKRALHVCRTKYKTGKKTKRLVCEKRARKQVRADQENQEGEPEGQVNAQPETISSPGSYSLDSRYWRCCYYRLPRR